MLNHIFLIPSVLIIFLISTISGQERQPTDTELKATWCLEYYKIGLDMMYISPDDKVFKREDEECLKRNQKINTEIQQKRAEFIEKMNRLKMYIASRISSVDVLGLMLATKQAQYDLNTKIPTCIEQCRKKSPIDITQCAINSGLSFEECKMKWKQFNDKCNKECVGPEIPAKIESCQNLSWFPY